MDVMNCRVVVATLNSDGKAVFSETKSRAHVSQPGLMDFVQLWESPADASVPHNIGAPPSEISFPVPGATRFALSCMGPRSEGKIDITDGSFASAAHMEMADTAMHKTDTVDYEVILSGKVDLELDGVRTTVKAGDCVVMGGIMHAWHNPYDEPCIMAITIVGARN